MYVVFYQQRGGGSGFPLGTTVQCTVDGDSTQGESLFFSLLLLATANTVYRVGGKNWRLTKRKIRQMIDVVFVKKHASPVCLIKSLLQTGAGSPVFPPLTM